MWIGLNTNRCRNLISFFVMLPTPLNSIAAWLPGGAGFEADSLRFSTLRVVTLLHSAKNKFTEDELLRSNDVLIHKE